MALAQYWSVAATVRRCLRLLLVVAPLAACGGVPGNARNDRLHVTPAGAPREMALVRLPESVELHAGSAGPPPYFEGGIRLRDGRTVVALSDSGRVLYYDRRGKLARTVDVKAMTGDPRVSIRQVQRVQGDTIAVFTTGSRALVLDGGGALLHAFNPYRGPDARRRIVVPMGMLRGNLALVAVIGDQSPRGRSRWIDTVTLMVVDGDMKPTYEARVPGMLLGAQDSSFTQVWFAPHAVIATADTMFYYGFGDRYAIEAFSSTGQRLRTISRPWQKVAVTSADIDTYIEGWAKNWIKETGREGELARQRMRSDPFFEYVPAFSQFLVSTTGELWVRSPNLIDAQGNGELYTLPLRPSQWSVFDRDGRWHRSVTLPERFMPTDAGADYVVGREHAPGGTRRIVTYQLR